MSLWVTILIQIIFNLTTDNQSILKEVNPEHSLVGLMLKLQYFGHLIQRSDSLEKILMLEKTEAGEGGDDRGLDGWMASSTQWT